MAAAHPERMKLSLSDHFGEASVAELERLVLKHTADGVPQHMSSKSFVEVLPQGAVFLLAGVLDSASDADMQLPPTHASSRATVKALTRLPDCWDANARLLPMRANANATVKVLTSFPRWTPEVSTAFGQRLLQMQEADLKLLAAPGGNDYAALRFLGEVLQKNMSAAEVARVLQEEQGQQLIKTFRTSPTLGAVVMYASWGVFDWLDDVWDWLKGAAQWVVDGVKEFGEWACKQAKAVVDSVFSQFPNATEILEHIPGVGLVVAGVYAMAGKRDEALKALAVNLNACVTLIGAGVGFLLGGPAGSMAGGALGKSLGLLIQHAIAQAIDDPKMKSETGDISATRFIIEVALAGAAYGGAAGIGEVLGKELGLSTIKTLATSVGLSALLSRLPGYFALKALDSA